MPRYLEDSSTQSAYNSIHDFFDAFGLEYAIKYTNSIIEATNCNKVWRKEAPSSLLFYMEHFKLLSAAVFIIYYVNGRRNEAIISEPEYGVPDISAAQNFMGEKYNLNSGWSNFPRHLTAKQYHNPYKAIKKFCTYMAEPVWNNYLKDVTEYALSKHSLDELSHPYNILIVRKQMMQLIEACHLIDIRTNREKIKSKKSRSNV